MSEQLRTTGRVQRGRLGVQIDQVSKEVAESLGLTKTQGALVRGVEQGSPAEKAGLEPGDIILKFDGKPIENRLTCRAWWVTPNQGRRARYKFGVVAV